MFSSQFANKLTITLKGENGSFLVNKKGETSARTESSSLAEQLRTKNKEFL